MESKIKELKELEAKATPNWYEAVTGEGVPCISASAPDEYHGLSVFMQGLIQNSYNIPLAVSMRNALPELLHKAQIACEQCADCESYQSELEDATEWISDMIKVVCKLFPEIKIEAGDDGDYYVADIADAIQTKLATLTSTAEKAEYDLNLCRNQLKYYNAHGDAIEEMRCASCQDIAGQSAADWKSRSEKAERAYEDTLEEARQLTAENDKLRLRAEKADAERDALINVLPGFCGVCPVANTEEYRNCPRPMEECHPLIAAWAAQEAAKAVN